MDDRQLIPAPEKCTLRSTLFEHRCLLCGARGGDGSVLCMHCSNDLPRLRGALPITLPFIDRVFAACTYAFPLDALIRAFKFQRDTAALRAGAELIASSVSMCSLTADIVVPVPLGRLRYLSRGYNQAVVLGRAAAGAAALELAPDAVRRIADRRPQSELGAAERRRNIQGVFAVRDKLYGRRVLLVDDVLSTGTTVSELARCCRQADASAIEVLTLAWNPVH